MVDKNYPPNKKIRQKWMLDNIDEKLIVKNGALKLKIYGFAPRFSMHIKQCLRVNLTYIFI